LLSIARKVGLTEENRIDENTVRMSKPKKFFNIFK
jgi:hypothetical protein